MTCLTRLGDTNLHVESEFSISTINGQLSQPVHSKRKNKIDTIDGPLNKAVPELVVLAMVSPQLRLGTTT